LTVAVSIGGREVGPGAPVFIIAEAGVNHDGDVQRAHSLVDVAADAGADAVKFQTFQADALAAADAPRAAYQAGRLGDEPSQHSMLKRLELPHEEWSRLRDHARGRGITFLSTPFDEGSLDLLVKLGIPAIKIGSGDLTNLRLIRRAASAGVPILCSTGMATLGEVANAVAAVREASGSIVLLHCVSSYPAPESSANLRAIPTLARVFDVPVGYSDHTTGRRAALAAAALGAVMVEKHFTTDRSLPGPDHRASLEPDDLKGLVEDIRAVESALGDGRKTPRGEELDTRAVARRSLAWTRDLAAGHLVTEADVIAKRPAGGIAPDREDLVLGRRLRSAVHADTFVRLDVLA